MGCSDVTSCYGQHLPPWTAPPPLPPTAPPPHPSQQAGSMHPTGMLSCFFDFFFIFAWCKGALKVHKLLHIEANFRQNFAATWGLCRVAPVVSQCFSMEILTGKKLTSTYLLH